MYPGYSPADHIYGEAAAEYGQHASKAKQGGTEIEHPEGMEYQIAQSKMSKQKVQERAQARKRDSTSMEKSAPRDTLEPKTHGRATTSPDQEAAAKQDEQPLFVVDTQPMKVDLPEMPKKKRAKRSHKGDLPIGDEGEDISAEVDAKLKEKREKKKHRKEEKKRKRDSDDAKPKKKHKDETAQDESEKVNGSNGAGEGDFVLKAEARETASRDGTHDGQPKRKKQKHEGDGSPSLKRVVSDGDEAVDEEGKKKKKRKKASGESD